jgi:hypothetical protein
MSNPLPIKAGDVFNRLTAVRKAGGNSSWYFRCYCGREKAIRTAKVIRGEIKTCGCGSRNNYLPSGVILHFYRRQKPEPTAKERLQLQMLHCLTRHKMSVPEVARMFAQPPDEVRLLQSGGEMG